MEKSQFIIKCVHHCSVLLLLTRESDSKGVAVFGAGTNRGENIRYVKTGDIKYPANVPDWVGPLFICLVLGALVLIIGRILWVTIKSKKKQKRREREKERERERERERESREGSSQS